MTPDVKRNVIEPGHPQLSLAHLHLMRLLDEQYTETPDYGMRRMTAWLQSQGYLVNRKRVARLMRTMGLETLYPKPRTSLSHPEHRVYPYLLRDVPITQVNQVWSTDMTYIRLHSGFLSLVAVMDWFRRYVVSWALSITMEVGFCLEALEEALRRATPDIFNSDQGAQCTSLEFTGRLEAAGIRISLERGWTGTGQCVCRAPVAHGETRGGVFERLSDATGGDTGIGAVLRAIQ